jgi:hypothetical protein
MAKCNCCNQVVQENNLTEIGLATGIFYCEKCWTEN